MEKIQAIEKMEEYARCSVTPEFAQELCNSFGISMDTKLIYKEKRYRETPNDPQKPRVCIMSLAGFICDKLGIEADKKLMEIANMMCGIGSATELETYSWCKSLRTHFNLAIPNYR